MKYEIITDPYTIGIIRERQDYQIFTNRNKTQAFTTVKLDELYRFIIQPDCTKARRHLITFNQHKDRRKTNETALIPDVVMLDVDLKKQAAQQQIIKDLGVSNYSEAFEKLVSCIKDDECCQYFDYSNTTGFGIKALFTVVSNFYEANYDKLNVGEYNERDVEIICELHKSNFEVLLQYLKDRYNLQFYNNDSIDYIDKGCRSVGLFTYSTNGISFNVNENAHLIAYHYQLDCKKLRRSGDNPKEEKLEWKVYSEKNNDYCDKLSSILVKLKQNDKDTFNDVIRSFDEIFGHYNYKYLVLFSSLNQQNRGFIYNIFQHLYHGDNEALVKAKRSYEEYNKLLNQIAKNAKWSVLMKDVFRPFLTNLNTESDFFNNKYDITIKFDQYISEIKDQLGEIIYKHDKIVIRSDAGTGKNTFTQQFLKEVLVSDKIRKGVLCIPKNSLLDQQMEIYQEGFKGTGIAVEQMYGNMVAKDVDGKQMILCSTPGLAKLKDVDLIITDEVQNLVKYSLTIYSNNNHDCKQIIISATPEMYLIGQNDYYYVNCVQKHQQKPTLNVIVSKSHFKILDSLLDKDRKQLIFHNDKTINSKIAKTYPDFGFVQFNTDTQMTKEVRTSIKNQIMTCNHSICTSFISDGINFNNDYFDDIIIIENPTLDVFENYQLSKRFRNATNINLYLIANPRPYSDTIAIDYSKFKEYEDFSRKIIKLKKLEEKLNKDVSHVGRDLANCHYFLKNKNSGKYFLNTDILKYDIYLDNYLRYYQQYQNVFNESLNYYFNVQQCFFLKNDKDELTGSTDMINIFKTYGEEFIHAYDAVKDIDKLELFNVQLTETERDFLKENEIQLSRYCKRYFELKDLNIDDDIIIDRVFLRTNNYNKFLNGFKRKELGKLSKEDILKEDNYSEYFWNIQEMFVNIVKNSGLIKTSAMGINYVSIDDLLGYFNANKTVYNQFMDETGEKYLFQLTPKSMGKWINGISRAFKQIRIGKDRVKVYKFCYSCDN